MFVTLRCAECDNTECSAARAYVPQDSLEGCTRKLSDQESEEFYHLTEEVRPFLHLRPVSDATRQQFTAIDRLLDRVYLAPIGRKLGTDGRVKG